MRGLVSAVVSTLLLAVPAHAVAGTQSGVPAPAAGSTGEYVFPPGAGLLFFYVRPEKRVDFEAVIDRLVAVLAASTDPVRSQQAATWQLLRSVEPVGDATVYVFLFNPVVPALDYDPIKILAEGAPKEVTALYERLKGAVIRVERMALEKIR